MSLLFAMLFAQAGQGVIIPPVTCPPDESERARLLALPPDAFDQEMTAGWRPYGFRKCYRDAAALLDAYAQAHEGSPFVPILRWHQFQMLAYAGDRPAAVAVLDIVDALDSRRSADAGWRHYVAGTRAFMEGRRSALEKAITALDAYAESAANRQASLSARLNNNVLRGLLRCFGKPYAEAYESPCVDLAKVREINAAMQAPPSGAAK